MSKMKILLSVAVCLFLVNTVFPQNEKRNDFQPSYEVKLQILSASNKTGGKSEVPNSLSTVVEKLREDYSYKNFDLVETYIERILSNGKIDFRGVSNRLLDNDNKKSPIFYEWILSDLESVKNPTGKDFLKFDSLRFTVRVPITTGEATNYDSTGFALIKFNLPENAPTLAGSFSMPQADEFVFIILTVKKIEE